jgi:hypothetical protein
MVGTWIKIATVALLLMASTLTVAADQTPDATLEFSGGSVGVGVGVQWGKGTLHYNGKTYLFHLHGLSLGDIGAEGIRGTGEVYHLANVDYFSGNYRAIETAVTLANNGESVAALKNASGVVIQLHSKTQGLALDASVEGVAIRFGGAQ